MVWSVGVVEICAPCTVYEPLSVKLPQSRVTEQVQSAEPEHRIDKMLLPATACPCRLRILSLHRIHVRVVARESDQ